MTLIYILLVGLIYIYWQIKCFKLEEIKLKSPKLDSSIKICQITDYHSSRQIDLDRLVEKVGEFDPDFIVLTGDIIDRRSDLYRIKKSLELIEALSSLKKDLYFVTGNHEIYNPNLKYFLNSLSKLGVNILDNKSTTINIGNNKIKMAGIRFDIIEEDYRKFLGDFSESTLNILLSHSPRPYLGFKLGKEDIILSGHTHGGQVRLPLVGAVISPSEGLFPNYSKGLYNINGSSLYIDSGLGTSIYPIRILNRAQISNITIESEHS